MTDEAQKARSRAHYLANREKILARSKERYQANRDKRLAQGAAIQKRWQEEDQEGYRAAHRGYAAKYYERDKGKVFDHYGWLCACCGSDDQPSIDHIAGNGKEHRLELFGNENISSIRMYAWLIRNNFPPGFQTLCAPCNASKRNGPACRLDHGAPS